MRGVRPGRLAAKLVPVGAWEATSRYRHLRALGVPADRARRGAVSRWYKACQFGLLPPGALARPKLMVDVGANLGDWSAAMLDLACPERLIAIEPQNDLGLVERLSPWPHAHVEHVALGARDDEIELNVTTHSAATSVLTPVEGIDELYGGGLAVRHRRMVPLRRLDSLVSDPVDLLKLDVQGYETHVLEGATRVLGETKFVQLEVTFRPHYEGDTIFPDLHRRMVAEGFDLLNLSEVFIRSGVAMWADALYGNQRLIQR